jgi:hypothetical protein
MDKPQKKKIWFVPPSKTHTTIIRILRNSDAEGLIKKLSTMCDRYWEFYCDVHDDTMNQSDRIQSWFHFRAYVAILKEYGWWDRFLNQPVDWSNEEEGETNGGNTKRT